jgi:hypothetical protein
LEAHSTAQDFNGASLSGLQLKFAGSLQIKVTSIQVVEIPDGAFWAR